ncbi:TRAP transporter substrate-binding protein [Salinicola halimionae]|uniref:TRAP transporter substrate-binding protein n=1 Tax=Salinicola halimionae TaxID=1949081 RepID=UPI000DA114F0|nr:TRAP transporter substrate-binding protein [Salinicola halimionae]
MNNESRSFPIGTVSRRNLLIGGAGLLGMAAFGIPLESRAAPDAKKLKFAYEGPRGTGQEIGANVFQQALEKASNGKMTITQYPGAQLGSEPTLLRKVTSGDIDVIISSTANASQFVPQSGVFSLHYLVENFGQVEKAVTDEKIRQLYIEMARQNTQGAEPLALFTLPLRDFFAPKTQVHDVGDLKGKKFRVQATQTEDTFFSAYGAIPVHMPFTEVYTSLQTGVIDMAENAISYYGSFKLYEVAPVVSLSQHEGNFQVLWISSRALQGLTSQEREWVQEAAVTTSREQPPQAADLVEKMKKKYAKMGIEFYDKVDKQSFIDIATPLQDKIAHDLGPHAVKILDQIRTITT